MTSTIAWFAVSNSLRWVHLVLWLVPVAYLAVFLHRQFREEAALTLAWLPPLLQLGLWSAVMALSPTPPPLLSAGWGLISLSLAATPLLLDRDVDSPEWLSTGLLLAGLTSLLWMFLLTSQISKAQPGALATFSFLATFLGAGLLLNHSMVAWQLSSNTRQQPDVATRHSRTLRRLQLLSMLALLVGLTLLLLQGWTWSLLSWGLLLLTLFAYGSLLLPNTQPAHHSPAPTLHFSPPHALWAKSSGLLTVIWLFLHLVLTA